MGWRDGGEMDVGIQIELVKKWELRERNLYWNSVTGGGFWGI